MDCALNGIFLRTSYLRYLSLHSHSHTLNLRTNVAIFSLHAVILLAVLLQLNLKVDPIIVDRVVLSTADEGPHSFPHGARFVW